MLDAARRFFHIRILALLCVVALPLVGASSVAAAPSVSLEPVAQGLGFPVHITHAGDQRLFISLKGGEVLILDAGVLLPEPFLDLSGTVGTRPGDGLFSIAFHPAYSENGFFFVAYTDPFGETFLVRYQVSDEDPDVADPASARTLLRITKPQPAHHGGQLQFGPDGYLYLSTGDSGLVDDPSCLAQADDSLLGKMLRLDVDQNVDTAPFYGIPADNPFVGPGAPLDEIWAKGFRNPWRFSFDRLTGDLFIGDVGQDLREEIDFQPAASLGGENYGWKRIEGDVCRDPIDGCTTPPPACGSNLYAAPSIVYSSEQGVEECSVTGGYVYRGGAIPDLFGAYVYGDYCSGRLWAARPVGGGWEPEPLAIRLPGIVSFGEDLNGELYLAANDSIYRLVGRAQQSGPCIPGPQTLCLQQGRFRVEADWRTRTGEVGVARAETLTTDTGYFWFFDAANVEVVVKVLDACTDPFNRFWVFAGGLTNVEVRMTVYDTQAEEAREYLNPLRQPFQPIQDTQAFMTCP